MQHSVKAISSPIHAPEIARPGLIWLNTPAPIPLEKLKGRLVLLDFWTLCCINCMHVLPTLRKVEEMFPNEVAVIGVHSPKFAAEKDIVNLHAAVARYDIRHPVIHDPEMILWREYDVHAWPTLVFVDPLGHVIGKSSGEPELAHLLNAVRDILERYEGKADAPLPLILQPEPKPVSKLLFPGKIKPLPGGAVAVAGSEQRERTAEQSRQKYSEKRWIVADAGHHQIAVFDDHGKELQRIGSGKAGFADGAAESASFNSPQGLIADEKAIYVADTSNHSLRKIDRTTWEVTTLAGNGERGMMLINKFEPARTRALASPWDVEIKDNILFFANAGTHQLGAVDLEKNVLRVIAGNGSENIFDGVVLHAELAQPSALLFSRDYSHLYFADSETSSVRALLMREGIVETIVGSGLFDFGHINGPFDDARLQHALGIALLNDENLLVADSYNAVLRRLDLAKGAASDLDENAWNCTDPLCLPFAEPAGIWADGENRVLVSDTNNHRIIEIDRAAKTTKTWV